MKKKKCILGGLLLLIGAFSLAFKFPDLKLPEVSPYVKYRLSKLPLIGRFVEPPPPPEKEYLEVKGLIEELNRTRAERYVPKLYRKIRKKWERAEEYYQTGHYDWALSYFKELRRLSREALDRTRAIREKKKKEAREVLKKLRSAYENRRKELSPETRLKIELVLWRLETLIELEEFDRFATEAEEARKNYRL